MALTLLSNWDTSGQWSPGVQSGRDVCHSWSSWSWCNNGQCGAVEQWSTCGLSPANDSAAALQMTE